MFFSHRVIPGVIPGTVYIIIAQEPTKAEFNILSPELHEQLNFFHTQSRYDRFCRYLGCYDQIGMR